MTDPVVDDRLHKVHTLLQPCVTEGYGLEQQGDTDCTDGVTHVTECTNMMQLVSFTVCPDGHGSRQLVPQQRSIVTQELLQ